MDQADGRQGPTQLELELQEMRRKCAKLEAENEELRQANDKLQSSEQQWAKVIATANAPIFGINREGKVNVWNLKAVAITGFEAEDVMGQNLVAEFILPEHRIAVRTVLDNALGGEETSNYEFPLITKDKRRVQVLLNASSRRDASGAIVGVLGIGQDITERVAQEQEYIKLIDTANAPIFGINTEGKVNEWNIRAAEITGFSKDEVMGRDLVQEFITEDYQESVKRVLDCALRGRETANYEFVLMTKQKERVEVLLNATTRRDATGTVVGVVGIGQDITDKKQAEKAQKVFLASFSHELRTPLHGIMAMLQNLSETVSPTTVHDQVISSVREDVTVASTCAKLLLYLVNDILDLSKFEAGQIEFINQPFDLHLLLQHTLQMGKAMMMSTNIHLTLQIQEGVPQFVVGDQARLGQIILNLISNSIKFTQQGHIQVRCEKKEGDPTPVGGGEVLYFEVQDTGIGMSQEACQNVFGMFTKGSVMNSTGSGIGLAICRQLVEMLGGTISATSKEQEGTTFHWSLPFQRPTMLEEQAMVLENARTQEDTFDDQIHFLLVEDNIFNVKVITNFFRNEDHITCDVANNGKEAVDIYKENHKNYDLCIMDIQMPIMNGFEATRQIRAFERENDLDHVCILGLSADGMKETHTSAFKVGMDQFETKPIGKPQLLRFFLAHNNQQNTKSKSESCSSSDDKSNEDGFDFKIHFLLVEDNAFNVKVIQSYFRHHDNITFDVASNGKEAIDMFKVRHATYDLCIMDIQMAVMDGYAATVLIRQWEIETAAVRTCILGLSANSTSEAHTKAKTAGMDFLEAKPISKASLLKFLEELHTDLVKRGGGTEPQLGNNIASPNVVPGPPVQDQ